MSRPTPFDLVFGQSAPEVFTRIQAAVNAAGHDPRDRDRFLMIREVVTLVRELRPEEGLGEGIDQLAALVHHAYLFWQADARAIELTSERLADLLRGVSTEDRIEEPSPFYAQMPQHRIWAEVLPGQPPEPLDGCFIHPTPDAALRVLGVFGVHPERAGFSVVEATGPKPVVLARADGTALFAPTLTGGKAAGLFSITGSEELLELGWRTSTLAGAAPAEAGRWRV
jgi:hypothetical protein